MRVVLCNSASPLTPIPKPPTFPATLNWPHKTLVGALTGAVSFSLLISSPSSIALDSASVPPSPSSHSSATDYCRQDDDTEAMPETAPELVTNEAIVEEAWNIVNDSFLDSSRRRWSSDIWKVKHGNCGPVQSIEVQRQLVARTPVFYRLEKIENGAASVGYMRLKEFNALARKDLVIAMKRLQDMGAKYFILDLRDNLGGLVQAGIEIAKLFLNEGETVTYTVGRDPQYEKTITAETAPLITAPLIVLVNNKTASASEIVSAALHDNCRAVLVGQRTFGKGLIQSVFELHDGSGVVVTIGKYVTPNHMDINKNGIEPDFREFPAWSEVTQHLAQCNTLRQG